MNSEKRRSRRRLRRCVLPILAVAVIGAVVATAWVSHVRESRERAAEAAREARIAATVKEIGLDTKQLVLCKGDVHQLVPAISPDTAKKARLVWNTTDSSIAGVKDGAVSAAGAGSCRITVKAPGGASASCDITVYAPAVPEQGDGINKLTVLMFHSIEYEKGNILRVPKEDFEQEMKWLHDNGYKALTPDELYANLVTKTPFPAKSVMITLDDGYMDNYLNAFPILKKYGLHATIFMISGDIGQYGYLTADMLKEMSDSGFVSVECHTVTHPDLSSLSADAQRKELSDSKAALEKLLGKKVGFLAYPSGKYNANTVSIAKDLGYSMCFRENGGAGQLADPLLEFPRAFVGDNLNDFIRVVRLSQSASSASSR